MLVLIDTVFITGNKKLRESAVFKLGNRQTSRKFETRCTTTKIYVVCISSWKVFITFRNLHLYRFIMWKSLSVVLFCFILSVVLYSSLTDAQTAQRTVNRFQTCRDVNFCCPGRNNTCYAFGPRRDGNVNESKCFCDDNCRAMNDCCIDHESYCEYQRGECF